MTESTANYIQVVIAGLTFLVFVGLAVVTLHYARQTKRMADIMSKEFEVRFRPFVDVRVGIPFMQDDCSGFKIPLEILLLGEFPFRLTKFELEIQLGEEEILKIVLPKDVAVTRHNPALKECVEGFSDERISNYYKARSNDPGKKEIQVAALSLYSKNAEGKEELFQRLPVPYKNYYELDKICSRGSDTIAASGRRISEELDEF